MSDPDLYESHRYRLVWWKRWPLFIVGMAVVESLRTFPSIAVQISAAKSEAGLQAYGLLWIFMAVLLGLLLLLAGELLFSFIEVRPAGIKLRLWPFQTLEYTWDEVSSISRSRIFGLFPYDIISLAHAQRTSFSTTAVLKQSVVLSDFRGWPNGKLAEDIHFYASRLFTTGDEKLQTQS